jgi:uncharacterized integral membrane protein
MSRYWNLEISSAKEKKRKPWLLRAIWKAFGQLYIFGGLIQLILLAVFRLANKNETNFIFVGAHPVALLIYTI